MLWLLTLVLLATIPVEVSVSPRVTLAGGTVRVTCKVERHPDNRRIEYGLELVRREERNMEGEEAPRFWELWIQHVPCEPGLVFCEVYRVTRQSRRVTAPLEVAGCE